MTALRRLPPSTALTHIISESSHSTVKYDYRPQRVMLLPSMILQSSCSISPNLLLFSSQEFFCINLIQKEISAQTCHLLPLGCSSSEHLLQLLINTVTFSIWGFHCGCESQYTAAVMYSFPFKLEI